MYDNLFLNVLKTLEDESEVIKEQVRAAHEKLEKTDEKKAPKEAEDQQSGGESQADQLQDTSKV